MQKHVFAHKFRKAVCKCLLWHSATKTDPALPMA